MKTVRPMVWGLGIAATLVSFAWAQQGNQQPVENRYRVGIDCLPISEPLQVHLNLDQGTGLLVNEVMEESPADKAGLRRLDVIVAANERPVGEITELVRAVNEAGETKMSFRIIRRGEETTLNVTPEQRDEQEIEQIRRGFRNRLRGPRWPGWEQFPPDVQKQLERFGPLDIFGAEDGFGRGFRRMLPGIMMDQPPFRLPHGFNLNMQVERTGDGPAKIKVEHDGKSWEVTEDHLDDLPEEIRPMVENMLNGGRSNWSGLMLPQNSQGRVLRQPSRRPAEDDDKQLKQRFDGLELQLQELQNAIRSLQSDEDK